MRTFFARTFAVLIVVISIHGYATTRYVAIGGDDVTGDGTIGNPFATIQRGVTASQPSGDTVIVRDGVFSGSGNRNIDLGGRQIIVRSENGALATTIDCQSLGNGFSLQNGEPNTTRIIGFTIINGLVKDVAHQGGGIYCNAASPSIEDCIITNCQAWGLNFILGTRTGEGGGIFLQDSSAIILNCQIINNQAIGANRTSETEHGYAGTGGGIQLLNCPLAQITNCTITGNRAVGGNLTSNNASLFAGAGRGGGIYLANSGPVFSRCLIADNIATGGLNLGLASASAAQGGGVYTTGPSFQPGQFVNCTINGNTAKDGSAFYIASGTWTLLNVTAASNPLIQAGGVGVRRAGGTLNLKNTLIAYHTQSGNLGGTITSQGNNLSSDLSVVLGGAGDVNNTDPVLGPLQNNGGSNSTRAIGPGSPALDAGTNTGAPALDQRGGLRPIDGDLNLSVITDIGAFEFDPAGPTPTPGASPTSSPSPTISPSPTASASATRSPTSSPTPSVSSTATASPTPSASPTATATLTPTPFDDASVASHTVPAQIPTDHPVPVTFTMQNTGNTTWSAADGFTLSFVTDDCALSLDPEISLPPGASILPGQSAVFTATLIGPSSAPQTCQLDFQMSHGAPFGAMGQATVNAVTAANNSSFVGNSIPAVMYVGQGLNVDITVRNLGNTTWMVGGNYSLTPISDPCSLIVNPFLLFETTGPNKNISMPGYIVAPGTPGSCNLQLRMNEDSGEGLFGATFNVTIQVINPPNATSRWNVYE